MKNVEKIVRILAAVIGYGWLWGVNTNGFTRKKQLNGEWRTYHADFDVDDFGGDDIYSWPYGSSSEKLFLENFPGEKITGSGHEGRKRWITSRPKVQS